MILPEEVDNVINYCVRWLEHGDRVMIAEKAGKTKQWVSQVLNKKGKDFKVVHIAYQQAQRNERIFSGKETLN